MRVSNILSGFASAIALTAAGCASAGHGASGSQPAQTVTHVVTVTPSAAPTVTQTVTAPPSSAPAPPPAVTTQPSGIRASTPWAVVSEYYGDIESGDYADAYALLSNGAVTGQTYQQFVAGFACTAYQGLTDLGAVGDTVTISLQAVDGCKGTAQTYTGTYTVQGGVITAADIHQTG
jgi:hypothetical protein